MNFGTKMETRDPLEDLLFWREPLYRFLKDVLNKTLTFEVPTPPKMEAENYKKTFKFDVRYKINKFSKISRFGVCFGSQNRGQTEKQLIKNET